MTPEKRRRLHHGRRCTASAALPRIAAALALVAVVGACTSRGPGGGAHTDGLRPVILIVVDTLRADHLGVYGYARDTSPNLDSLADRGRVFEHAWATSPWTLPSFGSIFTGQLPSAHSAGIEVGEAADADVEVVAARNFVRLGASVPTIAEVLAGQGFATGAFVTNPFLEPRFGLDRGFADYDHYDTSNAEMRRAGEVVDLGLAWIDGHQGQPFFLLLHLFDPHLDYDAPAPFRGRFTEPLAAADLQLPVHGLWPIRNRVETMPDIERQFIAAAYDEEVAYVDAELGRFFAELESRGTAPQTTVILTADHGEELFEHGGFEHGHAMYDEVLRVPLILWGPAVVAGRDATPVSLLDVAPTVLDAAGVQAGVAGSAARPIDTGDPRAEGASLLRGPGLSLLRGGSRPIPADRDIVAERLLYGPETKSIVSWPYKAILEVETSEAKLFDLSSDAAEGRDLAAQRADVLRAMLGRLSATLATAKALGVGAEAELDEELLRRLRALGYIR